MGIIDLLSKMVNGEIAEDSIFYVNGDFFYYLIVIDKQLYAINTRTKQLELLENKYIAKFIIDNIELLELKNTVELIEEINQIIEGGNK